MAANILQAIVADKRAELADARAATPPAELRAAIADLPPTRDFGAALRDGGVSLIAEVKKASPSAGIIRDDFDPVAIARGYEAGGAAAISVLTDAKWFQGSPDHLRAVRAAVDLPLLRKDFVVDEYQLLEARAWGADAALLIVAVLGQSELVDLAAAAAELGLAALVEVHSAGEAERAAAAGCVLVGINNRDLTVFQTDLSTTLTLRPLLPDDCTVVSESGISSREDIERLAAAPVDAVLVGESLMRRTDVAAACRALLGAGLVAS